MRAAQAAEDAKDVGAIEARLEAKMHQVLAFKLVEMRLEMEKAFEERLRALETAVSGMAGRPSGPGVVLATPGQPSQRVVAEVVPTEEELPPGYTVVASEPASADASPRAGAATRAGDVVHAKRLAKHGSLTYSKALESLGGQSHLDTFKDVSEALVSRTRDEALESELSGLLLSGLDAATRRGFSTALVNQRFASTIEDVFFSGARHERVLHCHLLTLGVV